jgi:hypothetical protein
MIKERKNEKQLKKRKYSKKKKKKKETKKKTRKLTATRSGGKKKRNIKKKEKIKKKRTYLSRAHAREVIGRETIGRRLRSERSDRKIRGYCQHAWVQNVSNKQLNHLSSTISFLGKDSSLFIYQDLIHDTSYQSTSRTTS